MRQPGFTASCPYVNDVPRNCNDCTQTCSKTLEGVGVRNNAESKHLLRQLSGLVSVASGGQDFAEAMGAMEQMEREQVKVNHGKRKDSMDNRQVRAQWRKEAKARFRK